MRRIENEPDLARPAGYLFDQVRTLFPIQRQPGVRRAIELHVELAQRLLELRPAGRRECVALNRQGASCRREAVGGGEYCPSHRHLEPATGAPALGSDGDPGGRAPLRSAL
jgi:hypothetical protein